MLLCETYNVTASQHEQLVPDISMSNSNRAQRTLALVQEMEAQINKANIVDIIGDGPALKQHLSATSFSPSIFDTPRFGDGMTGSPLATPVSAGSKYFPTRLFSDGMSRYLRTVSFGGSGDDECMMDISTPTLVPDDAAVKSEHSDQIHHSDAAITSLTRHFIGEDNDSGAGSATLSTYSDHIDNGISSHYHDDDDNEAPLNIAPLSSKRRSRRASTKGLRPGSSDDAPATAKRVKRKGAGKVSHVPAPQSGALPLSVNGPLPINHRPARGRGRAQQLKTMTKAQIEAEAIAMQEKNRLAARELRLKRKQHEAELETRVNELEAREAQSQKLIAKLQAKLSAYERGN